MRLQSSFSWPSGCSQFFPRFDYLLISHFLLNLQNLSNVTTNHSDSSRPSFVRSNPSSIRFDRVLGNIGAPLRDGSLGFGENGDEDVGVVLGQESEEIQEVRRNDEERRAGSGQAIHEIEECVAGPQSSSVRAHLKTHARVRSSLAQHTARSGRRACIRHGAEL